MASIFKRLTRSQRVLLAFRQEQNGLESVTLSAVVGGTSPGEYQV
jgi:hypothetical protein